MPTSDSRIRRVASFHELATTSFTDGINALCWERSLPGDFAEVVALLSDPKSRASVLPVRQAQGPEPVVGQTPGLVGQTSCENAPEENEGIVTIQPAMLESLLALNIVASAAPDRHPRQSPLVASGPALDANRALTISALRASSALQPSTRAAIETLLSDLQLLRAIDRDPVLNLIHAYPHDDGDGPVPTDVYSFHADSAPVPADTWLCTYHGPPSEGLRNEDAVRKVDVPEIRAELLKLHGGPDDESFTEFLSENHYDLHFAPLAACDAIRGPYSFGLFNLWRICCDYPKAPVPPCVHRAPMTQPGDAPRLLLIS